MRKLFPNTSEGRTTLSRWKVFTERRGTLCGQSVRLGMPRLRPNALASCAGVIP